jgi:hypothetical protein
VEIVSLVGETFLQSRSAGLVKANVQDQFFGHGFSIPECNQRVGLAMAKA